MLNSWEANDSHPDGSVWKNWTAGVTLICEMLCELNGMFPISLDFISYIDIPHTISHPIFWENNSALVHLSRALQGSAKTFQIGYTWCFVGKVKKIQAILCKREI